MAGRFPVSYPHLPFPSQEGMLLFLFYCFLRFCRIVDIIKEKQIIFEDQKLKKLNSYPLCRRGYYFFNVLFANVFYYKKNNVVPSYIGEAAFLIFNLMIFPKTKNINAAISAEGSRTLFILLFYYFSIDIFFWNCEQLLLSKQNN